MRIKTDTGIRFIVAFVLLTLIFFSLTGCATISGTRFGSYDIYCVDEITPAYEAVIGQTLPSYSVGSTTRFYPAFQQRNTTAAETTDPQAVSLREHGIADYWYPHYLATLIIAVDRDRTDADIRGWQDLPTAKEVIGINNQNNYHMTFSAISYGIEGDGYTLTGAAKFFSQLRKSGFLQYDSEDHAIVICYDFQAVSWIKDGRNIEIIVPREGTISYERGLLSHTELSFTGDVDSLLLAAGFRLTDGRCDNVFYPDAAAYEAAARVLDYKHFNDISMDVDRVFRREVLNTRLYSSADGREHHLFPLLYMIVLIVWFASVFNRAMQKNVRRSALFTGIILLGWMTVRLMKYSIVDETTLGLYLWYSYYLFQLALPLVALWLANSIDRPDGSKMPKLLIALTVLNITLIILTFTTHLHGFVYQIDFGKQRWAAEYGYGPGYTIIQIVNYTLLGLAIVMMLIKCGHSFRKKSLIFPLAFIAVLFLYGYGYYAQIPIARDSDITMVTGLLTLLFFESAVRTGLIPVNTKYTAFFANTPLGIKIVGDDGKTMLASALAVEYKSDDLTAALQTYPLPLPLNENTLLFASEIRGGNVLWQEDITVLNLLNAEIDESVRRRSATNAMLTEEEKIKRILVEENEKRQLMARLEAEITGYTEKLSVMAQQFKYEADQAKGAAVIALLLCFIKRRCNLFFWEQESRALLAVELTGYLEELAGIAAYSDKMITVSSDVTKALSVRQGTLFYTFFYSVIEWASQQSSPHVMAHLLSRNGFVIMRLLPYADPKSFSPDQELAEAIVSADGKFDLEDLDDAAAISLSFPEGGEDDG